MLGYYIAAGVLVVGVVAWLKIRRRSMLPTPIIKGTNLVLFEAVKNGHTRLYPTEDGGVAGGDESSGELVPFDKELIDWRMFTGRLRMMSMDPSGWPPEKRHELITAIEKDTADQPRDTINTRLNFGDKPVNIKQLPDEDFIRIEPQPDLSQ